MGDFPEKSLTNSIVFIGICAIPMIASVLFGSVSSGTFTILLIFLAVLQLFVIISSWQSKRLFFSNNLLQIPFIAIILFGLFQLLPFGSDGGATAVIGQQASRALTIDPTLTKFAIIRFTVFLLFFATALVFVNTPARLKKVVYSIIIFASIMAFIGIIQRLASPNVIFGIREVDYATPFASYINQHHFAAFMEMIIGLTLGMLFGNAVEKDKRLLLIIAVILMGIAVILTGSRGGFLSLIVILGFLVLTNVFLGDPLKENDKKIASKKNLILVGSSVGLMLLLVSLVIWLGQESSVERIGDVNQVDFTTGRTHFWSVAIEIFKNNPIIGTGLDTFQMAFTQYDTWSGSLRIEQAHNDYLQTLTDAGIIGFAILVSFIGLLYYNGFRMIKKSGNLFRRGVAIGALAGCTGILFHSFVDFPLRTNANMLFFLLLVTIANADIPYPKRFRKPKLVQPDGGI